MVKDICDRNHLSTVRTSTRPEQDSCVTLCADVTSQGTLWTEENRIHMIDSEALISIII